MSLDDTVETDSASDLLAMVTSVSELARRFIEGKIIRGELRPGEKVTEAQIANHLNISRSPVREAFSALEAKGLLVQRPRKGVVVSDIDASYIWEVYTLQGQFYVAGLTLSWDKIGAGELSHLDQYVRKMEYIASATSPNIEEYQELNHAFHLYPIIVSGHKRLLNHANDYHVHVKRLSYVNMTSEASHLGHSVEFHREIFEEIKNRNLDASVKLLLGHVQKGLDSLLTRFRPGGVEEE